MKALALDARFRDRDAERSFYARKCEDIAKTLDALFEEARQDDLDDVADHIYDAAEHLRLAAGSAS